jgi:3-hydroxybutyryl-CoA dehydrogenase
MPLVEVIPGERTDPRYVDEIMKLLEGNGKTPIVVPDVPGFLWNRLQFALLREATRLVSEYGVPPETIDLAVRRVLGRRWSLVGPFETMALGGRDTFVKIAQLLFAELGHPVDPDALAEIDLPSAASLRALASQRDERLLQLRKRDIEEEGR